MCTWKRIHFPSAGLVLVSKRIERKKKNKRKNGVVCSFVLSNICTSTDEYHCAIIDRRAIGQHLSADPLLRPRLFHPSFFLIKIFFAKFVFPDCLSHCSCRLLAAGAAPAVVGALWLARLLLSRSPRCPGGQDREAKQSKRFGLCRLGRFGRHVLGSKALRGGLPILKKWKKVQHTRFGSFQACAE